MQASKMDRLKPRKFIEDKQNHECELVSLLMERVWPRRTMFVQSTLLPRISQGLYITPVNLYSERPVTKPNKALFVLDWNQRYE